MLELLADYFQQLRFFGLTQLLSLSKSPDNFGKVFALINRDPALLCARQSHVDLQDQLRGWQPHDFCFSFGLFSWFCKELSSVRYQLWELSNQRPGFLNKVKIE